MEQTLRVAVINDTRSDGHFGCSLVMRQIVALLREHCMEPAWFWPVGRDWHGAIEGRLADIDGLVVNGEGTIHHTAERNRARWLCELAYFARKRGLPAFLVNAGLYDIDPESARCLSAYSGIYVRDRYSQRLLARHGIASNVVPDLSMSAAFSLPDIKRRGVLVTDSVVPEVTRQLRAAARHRRWRYRSLRFQKKGKLRLRSCLSDLPWFLANRKSPSTLPERFAAFTARHSLVVTGRYHMVAYCLLTRTPFLAVESNTPKIGALLRDALGSRSRLAEDPCCLTRFRPGVFDYFTPDEAAAIDAFLANGWEATTAMMERIRAGLTLQRSQK